MDHMEEKIFELKGVSFTYLGKFPALRDIDLEVGPGEKIALLGANGSGKSTLLQILDGLLFPQKGEVRFFGQNLTEESLKDEKFIYFFRKTVGLVFQNSDLQLFSGTVWDEISFGPIQLDLTQDEVEKRVLDVLKLMRVEDLRDRPPYQLSEGEKRKVAIGSVLSINPDILLLDEPTGGLDPKSSRELVDLIIGFHGAGKTIITATHDLHIVPEIADRIYVLDENKRIVARGKTEEILSNQDLLHNTNLIHIHKHRHKTYWHLHPHQHIDSHDHPHDEIPAG